MNEQQKPTEQEQAAQSARDDAAQPETTPDPETQAVSEVPEDVGAGDVPEGGGDVSAEESPETQTEPAIGSEPDDTEPEVSADTEEGPVAEPPTEFVTRAVGRDDKVWRSMFRGGKRSATVQCPNCNRWIDLMNLAERQQAVADAMQPPEGVELVTDVADVPEPIRIEIVPRDADNPNLGSDGVVVGEVACSNPACGYAELDVVLRGWPAG